MYQVLYRKWRPQTFEAVYGQPHVVNALRNEVSSGHLAHAYLFTGSRGTGKTTCAKILAKAANCLHPVNGDPCNECENCRGIDDGSILDVVEIDAASNNGVDDVRALRDEVNFAPSVAKKRVYIIDEVHMLSKSAFNALLKTLEEPPEYVIFILATTEAHKLLPTVLSRCQRFDFVRIPPEEIAARLEEVAAGESFTLDRDAAMLLARLADGALRDALSLLDQCLTRSEHITTAVVADACGLTGRDYIYTLSECVRTQDSAKALRLVDELYGASHDMARLCDEWLSFYRELMICKSVPDPGSLIVATDEELGHLAEEAGRYELPTLLHLMDTLHTASGRMNSGMSRRMEMELVVLKLCNPSLHVTPEALNRRMQELENTVKRLSAEGVTAAAEPPRESVPEPAPQPEREERPAPQAAPQKAAEPEAILPFENWSDVLSELKTTCPPLYGVLSESTAEIADDVVRISTDNPLFKTLVKVDVNRKLLRSAIASVTGRKYRLSARVVEDAAQEKQQTDPLADFLQRGEELGVPISKE